MVVGMGMETIRKGVYKRSKNTYLVTFGKEYKKVFSALDEAINHRIELENEYGVPKIGASYKEDLDGKLFGSYQIIGETGNMSTTKRKMLVKDLRNGEYKEFISTSLKGGVITGNKVEGTSIKMILKNIQYDKPINISKDYKGVYYDKERNAWCAHLKLKGKRVLYKRFETKQEAIEARLAAEEKYFKPILEKYENKKEND